MGSWCRASSTSTARRRCFSERGPVLIVMREVVSQLTANGLGARDGDLEKGRTSRVEDEVERGCGDAVGGESAVEEVYEASRYWSLSMTHSVPPHGKK